MSVQLGRQNTDNGKQISVTETVSQTAQMSRTQEDSGGVIETVVWYGGIVIFTGAKIL